MAVNILFLSDLHFSRTKADKSLLEKCSQLYIEAIGGLDEKWKPQIVAIAGDIGYEGSEDDYQFFTDTFLRPLLGTLEIGFDHVVTCPGNHDKDDSRFLSRDEKSAEAKWKLAKDAEESDYKKEIFKGYRTLCNEQKFVLDEYSIEPFQNYINFLKNNGIDDFDTTEYDYVAEGDAKYLYGHRKVEGIDFYCYNSAWDCLHHDKNDKGNLRIGPVASKAELRRDNAIAISMVHHPQDWLSVENISSSMFRKERIAYKMDIAVNGHMHEPKLWWDEGCYVFNIQLPTWLSNDTDKSLWQSYIFRIDIEGCKKDVMSIFWHKEGNSFHPVKDIVSRNTDLRMKDKLEKERENNHDMLDYLFIRLTRDLDEFLSRPSINVLQNIIDIIERLLRLTASESMAQVYNEGKAILNDVGAEEEVYTEQDTMIFKPVLIPAGKLYDEVRVQERDRTLTYQRNR